MKFSVRRATEKDVDRIMELLVQVDMTHHRLRPDLFKGNTTKYREDELKKILKDEDTPVFVCVDESDCARGHAFCIFEEVKNDRLLEDRKTIYIDDICVDEDYRHHHIATMLCDAVKAEAKQRGCYNLTLNVWTGNDAAERFYNAMGFSPQKTGLELIL